MIKSEEVYQIGQFHKPHGIHGELSFSFTDDVFDRVPCNYFVCQLDGIFVPFFIESYRFRSQNGALVKLVGVDSTEKAKAFINQPLFFPTIFAPQQEEVVEKWHEFLGYHVVDVQEGYLGIIQAVDDSTMNTLFVIEHEQGGELLVPANESFIVGVDPDQKAIEMDLPAGLLTIDELDDERDDEPEP